MRYRSIATPIIVIGLVLLLAACGTTPDGGGNGAENGNGSDVENGDGNGNGDNGNGDNGNGDGDGDNGNGDGDGDNGNGDGDSANVTKLGFVSLDASVMEPDPYEIDGAGAFFETSAPLPASILDDPLAEELESCSVFSLGSMPDPDPFPEPPGGVSFTSLDAGESLSVAAGGSTFATYSRETASFGGNTFFIYELEAGITGELPAALTLSVPGATFPAFTDAPFPSVPAFGLTAPSDGSGVTVDTTFTWDAAGEPNTHVTLGVRSNDFSTFVTCTTADDGSFAFPADTKAELGSGFAGSVSNAGRTSARVVIEADAALVLSVSSTQAFPFAGF